MRKPGHRCARTPTTWVVATIAIFIAALCILPYRDGHDCIPFHQCQSTTAYMERESLRYIPQSVVRTWRERDYLVVFGIPSEDTVRGRRRRHLQRTSCWEYSGVAARANNFTGEMLVLYVIGRHLFHGYTHSHTLCKEAVQWHDVLALQINEGKPQGFKGRKSIEVEVGMSRKTYLWFKLALQVFPNASYLAKADDDIFLRVPQYLVDLRTLPRRGVYWGRLRQGVISTGEFNMAFPFVSGYCATTSRDVAERLVSYEPLQRLASLPYDEGRLQDYLDLMMNHEDQMVGVALALTRHPIFLFGERCCRFHCIGKRKLGDCKYTPITKKSLVIHHALERHHVSLKRRFKASHATPVSFTPVASPKGFAGLVAFEFLC